MNEMADNELLLSILELLDKKIKLIEILSEQDGLPRLILLPTEDMPQAVISD